MAGSLIPLQKLLVFPRVRALADDGIIDIRLVIFYTNCHYQQCLHEHYLCYYTVLFRSAFIYASFFTYLCFTAITLSSASLFCLSPLPLSSISLLWLTPLPLSSVTLLPFSSAFVLYLTLLAHSSASLLCLTPLSLSSVPLYLLPLSFVSVLSFSPL